MSTAAIAASITPLTGLLPAVAPAAASASRLLHDRRLGGLWRALDAEGAVALTAVGGPADGRLYTLTVDSDAGGFAIVIATSDDAALALASAPDLGDALRALAALALFGGLAERLGGLALPGVRAIALAPLAASAAPRTGWCALRRQGAELARIALPQLPPRVQGALRAAARPGAPVHAWRALLRLPGAVSLGVRALSIDTLRSLETGDVLLLPLAASALDGAPALLRLGQGGTRAICAAGQVAGQGFTITGGFHMMDEDQALAAEPGSEPDSLGELELPVRFELETVSVSLADLEAIEPGYVIEFATPVAEARLRLVSCGLVIGHADLVAVSGRLGARITRLVSRDDTDQHNG